jgi:hypothetical protein
MRSVFGKSLAAATVGTLAAAIIATPAEARRYYHHDDDDAAIAISAGLIGLGVGAALASDGYGHRGYYYGRGYYGYDPYPYGYYGRGYYRPYGWGGAYYGHRRHCWTQKVWDPYLGRRIRVRHCR